VFADTLSLQVDGQAQANRLRERLLELWNAQVRGVATEHGSDLSFSTAFIANLQTALDGWLRCLMDEGLNGSGPWDGIKLVTDSRRNQYGYLNLIRTNGPNAPGIGVAAWLGTRAAKLWDLQSRLEFFSDNPCLIQTLILLRADGNDALTGQSGTTFRKAQLDGRDVRVCKYTPEHFHSLMAFTPWHQLAVQEVWDAEHSGNAEARATFRAFLSKLSGELLGWVDDWRKSSSLEANT